MNFRQIRPISKAQQQMTETIVQYQHKYYAALLKYSFNFLF